jgi:hypothetical protein
MSARGLEQAFETSERELEPLSAIVRALVDLADKLEDLKTLMQQQNDWLRRLLERRKP